VNHAAQCHYSKIKIKNLPDFFDINKIFLEVFGYKMSHLEFWATIFGGLAVWLSAKENVWSWILGLINVCLAFLMFYQIQLYPDMFLQIFFFITNLLGFWMWKYPNAYEANQRNELKISKLSIKNIMVLGSIGAAGTLLLGTFSKNLHDWFPVAFSLPSAFPYLDSFTTVMSIVATFLLIRKKLEAWWMWLIIDILSTYMYYIKDVKLYAILYFIFCIIAVFGAIAWTKKWKMGV
jgi:nicotinamide mononucleotide transporter